MTVEQAQKKISLLLNLTVANGATEAEAQTALERVQELKLKYGIKSYSMDEWYDPSIDIDSKPLPVWDDFDFVMNLFEYRLDTLHRPILLEDPDVKVWKHITEKKYVTVTKDGPKYRWEHAQRVGPTATDVTIIVLKSGEGINAFKSYFWNFHNGG